MTKKDCSRKFREVITKLVEVKRLVEKQGDGATWQYNGFLDTGIQNDTQECADFQPGSGRMLYRQMAHTAEYRQL